MGPTNLSEHSDGAGSFTVQLTLTVSAASIAAAPGLDQIDCGQCVYCLDKPRRGGAGTKRQKCLMKRMPRAGAAARVWASVHVVSERQKRHREAYSNASPPPQLLEAMQDGPLPLVWGFRRTRRARPLPPAYVLMFHCEKTIEVDRIRHICSKLWLGSVLCDLGIVCLLENPGRGKI